VCVLLLDGKPEKLGGLCCCCPADKLGKSIGLGRADWLFAFAIPGGFDRLKRSGVLKGEPSCSW